MMEVKKAGTTPIDDICSLELATWPVAYKEILMAEQMNYMPGMMCSEAALQKQIEK
jgi:hypothetical protein